MAYERYDWEPAGVFYNPYEPNESLKHKRYEFIAHAETKDRVFGQGHYLWPNPPGNIDVGGLWDITSTSYDSGYQDVGTIQMADFNVYSQHQYTGKVWTGFSNLTSLGDVSGNASSKAAEMYASMKPTKPVFQGLNAIYELKDVPEMLRQKMSSSGLKNIGNYYLALEFGWKPLLSDILATVNFQRKAEKKLKWLLKHNGKPVTTSYQYGSSDPEISPHSVNEDIPSPLFVSYAYRGSTCDTWTSTQDRIWASARFRYWLPDGPQDINWKRRQLAALYGLKPTPSAVYKAIPWTWLGDWFSNTGSVIQNLDVGVADRLAADYFYVMREREINLYRNFSTNYIRAGSRETVNATFTGTKTTRHQSRGHGDPFGWATKEDSLNAGQLAIMGALGLSRLG